MNRIESQVPTPTSTDASNLADWAEAVMFVEERHLWSKSSLRHRLRAALFVDGEDLDFHVDLLLSEVELRHNAAEATYPFSWSDVGISRSRDLDEAPYEFLLWLATSPVYRKQDRFEEIDELFDNLVKQALIGYLGTNSKGIRFASPASEPRPSGFPDAVKWLANILTLRAGASTPRPRRKDGGVDVVAWRPFRDRRSGFIVILCQCTVAQNWTPKAKDIVAGIWNGWIDFGLNPLTAIAVPFAVPKAFDRWDELRRTVNIILDRMRLVELMPVDGIEDISAIRKWNKKERSFLVISN